MQPSLLPRVELHAQPWKLAWASSAQVLGAAQGHPQAWRHARPGQLGYNSRRRIRLQIIENVRPIRTYPCDADWHDANLEAGTGLGQVLAEQLLARNHIHDGANVDGAATRSPVEVVAHKLLFKLHRNPPDAVPIAKGKTVIDAYVMKVVGHEQEPCVAWKE